MKTDYTEQLFGAGEPNEALHVRVLNDLHATLGAIINVYGAMHTPPTGVLTWPPEGIQTIYPLMHQMAEQLAKAEAARKDNDAYYHALAGALGLYSDALRYARRLGTDTRHQPVEYYCKAAQRFLKRSLDPELYILAAAGDPAKLRRNLLTCCKSTRKRFGEQLRGHGVTFDPPVVSEQYEYKPQPEGVRA